MAVYEDSVHIGSGRHRSLWTRRPRLLVVHFASSVDDARIAAIIASIPDVMSLEEPSERFEAFWLGRKRLIGLADDATLRTRAVELPSQFPGEILMATPVYRPQRGDDDQSATPLPGDVIVEVDKPIRALRRWLVYLRTRFRYLPRPSRSLPAGFHLFRLTPGIPRDRGFDMIERLRTVLGARGAEHDWLQLQTYHCTSDVYVNKQWGLREIGWKDVFKAQGLQAAPLVVADTGFDTGHEDLPGAFDLGRGLDAVKLWEANLEQKDVSPLTTPDGEASPHGTCVAGLIGAVVDNGLGIAGVAGVVGAAGASGMVPIRLGVVPSAGQVATAVTRARKLADGPGPGTRVLSLSLTTVPTSVLSAAIDDAVDKVVICAAAGNASVQADGDTVGFPARHAKVLGVGAVDCDLRRHTEDSADREAWRSRYGAGLDLMAPGVLLPTTDISGTAQGWNRGEPPSGDLTWYGVHHSASGDPAGRYFFLMDGTSAATPHVAAAAALRAHRFPKDTAEDLRNTIRWTCRPLTGAQAAELAKSATPLWDVELGYGLLDLGAAVTSPTITTPLPDSSAKAWDPCALPDLVVLTGYVAKGPPAAAGQDQLWRVYASDALDSWTEVGERDIVRDEPIGDGRAGRRVYVRGGAPLRQVGRAPRLARVAAPQGR